MEEEEAHWESEGDPEEAVDKHAHDEDSDEEEAADEDDLDGEKAVDKPMD